MFDVIRNSPGQQPAVLEWEVVDLLLSDEEFVWLTFQDIVAAEWPSTPGALSGNPPGASGSTTGAEKPTPSSSSATSLTEQQRRHGQAATGHTPRRCPCRSPSEPRTDAG